MRSVLSLAILLGSAAITPASAQGKGPGITPGGPYVTPQQTVRIDSLMSYSELTSTLQSIAASRDDVDVVSIGRSGEGRDIWLARIGDPENTPVMIITQQHGDEPLGTEAAMTLIKQLAGGKSRDILDQLFILIAPRVNVDGAEPQMLSGVPERGNTDYLAPRSDTDICPAAGGDDPGGMGIFTTDIRGDDGTRLWSYDVNRYHYAEPAQSGLLNWTDSPQYICNGFGTMYPSNPVPEAKAVLDAYFEYGPIWVVDIHHQGFHITNPDENDLTDYFRDGQRVTGGVLWPLNDGVDPVAVELSQQMALSMKETSLQYGHMEITRYDSSSGFAGIARNAYGLYGTERLTNDPILEDYDGPLGGSVLLEIDGQTEGSVASSLLGQKGAGHLTAGIVKMMYNLIEQTADGSLFTIDTDDIENKLIEDSNFRSPLAEEE